MKKLLKLIGLSVFALVNVLIWQGVIYARITGTNPTAADALCAGGPSLEVCIDGAANVVPTTNNVGTLGTTSLRWSNVYSNGITAASSVSVGTLTVTNNTVFSKTAIGSAIGAGGIFASTQVLVTSTYQTLQSSGGVVTLVSIPSIATGPAAGLEFASGTFLVLSSTATDAVVFQDEGTLTGSQLQLGAATRSISKYDTLTLIYDATDHFWREIAYGNN